MTCTAVTPQVFAEILGDLSVIQLQLVPVICVVSLLFAQFIWFAVIAPWITRRTSASLVELMQNEQALARLVRIRARRLQQSSTEGAEQ